MKKISKFEQWCRDHHRRDLVMEWNTEKNGPIPTNLSTFDKVKYNWKCCICGEEFVASVHDRLNGKECNTCFNASTISTPEYTLYYYIKKYFPDAVSCYKEVGFELDIYIPSKKTGIEYDGQIWHQDRAQKDMKKNVHCVFNNIDLIRVRENGLPAMRNCKNVLMNEIKTRDLDNAIIKVLELLGVKANENDINSKRDVGRIFDVKRDIAKKQKDAKMKEHGVKILFL